MGFIRSLFAQAGSLWVAWIHSNLLKNKCFWVVKIAQDSTGSWRNILKLRAEARMFIKFEVGSGKNIFLWHDLWHQMVFYIKNMGIELHMMQLVLQCRGLKCLMEKEIDSESKTCKIRKFGEPTKQDWFGGIGRGRQASLDSIQIWSLLLCRNLESHQKQNIVLSWWKVACFPSRIPKHAFIGRLVIQNGLATKDRLPECGLNIYRQCALCRSRIEGIDHLFC